MNKRGKQGKEVKELGLQLCRKSETSNYMFGVKLYCNNATECELPL